MTTTESITTPRLLTPVELAGVIRIFRDLRQWSQETLAVLSGLSVRTIQRVEKGEPSDLDTRRALARAFESEDLDIFNKPYTIPTPEELKKGEEEFEREHLILDTVVATTGRELARLFENATMDMSNPAIDLDREPAAAFAGLVDYLREYRDCAELYAEVQKLDVYDELQRYIDALDAANISVCYVTRSTTLVGRDWPDKTPWPVTLVYLSAFHKGQVPDKMAVPKKVVIGGKR
jgi:transcriptional regulator with XRE-family HTH domain